MIFMTNFNYTNIEDAHDRIRSSVLKTPLVVNEHINNLTNANVFFKLENLQWTGSFKLRGASNKLTQLNSEEKKRGIVAYSSGNHAQAVAYASKINNITATIIMPKNAPSIKINNTRNYGAEVILYDPFTDSRENIAHEISKEEGKTIIRPFDDEDIIAGQGTAGKEIAEDLLKLTIQKIMALK